MIWKSTIPSLLVLSLAISCSGGKKDMDLLTATPWKYEKAGFGSDDGDIFDALDPSVAGNEKDNTIIFHRDGTGSSQQDLKGKDGLPFLWAFQNNDSCIYFQNQYYKIRTLTNHRFEIYADQRLGESNTRYTIILSR